MKEYDVTVEFCNCKEASEIYTIEADTKEEAIEVAKEMALEDISITDVEDVTNYDATKGNKRYKQYILNLKDIRNEEWTLMKSKYPSYLIKIANEISLPDAKRIEVIGTDKPIEDYKSWNIIFTRRL